MTRPAAKLEGFGLGLRPQHFPDILNTPSHEAIGVDWFEIISENFAGVGGMPLRNLLKVRERFPVAMHGVSLSIGGTDPLDQTYLADLMALADLIEPAVISDHLCWTGAHSINLHDLLPLPLTAETLDHVAERIGQVQDTLGREIAIENASTYVTFTADAMREWDFLAELCRRAGCGLLLDVNNVYVACVNHDADPFDYLARFPAEAIDEIHLAGHAEDSADGRRLLIDAHDRAVCDAVWTLYRVALSRTGPKPTLIEWDNDVPDWPMLRAEAAKADAVLSEFAGSEVRHVA